MELTFSNSELGYLVCEEFRYKEKKKLIHTIGGKVEDYDLNLLETAIREFIEETNLEIHPIINKDKLEKKQMITYIYNLIIDSTYYIDICVNKENRFFHRYYLSNLGNCEFIDSIKKLPDFFNGKYTTEITNIHWIKFNDIENNKKNFSWLTKMFFKFIKK